MLREHTMVIRATLLLAAAVLLLPACGGAAGGKATKKVVVKVAPAKSKLKYPGRSFAGAPPVVPHEVEADQGDKDCLDCHLRGEGEEDAPVVAHPALINCLSCHVPRTGKGQLVGSRFVARRFGWKGDRAWSGAPPTIPHETGKLQRDCNACHTGEAPRGTPTKHGDRIPCGSCHVSGV